MGTPEFELEPHARIIKERKEDEGSTGADAGLTPTLPTSPPWEYPPHGEPRPHGQRPRRLVLADREGKWDDSGDAPGSLLGPAISKL